MIKSKKNLNNFMNHLSVLILMIISIVVSIESNLFALPVFPGAEGFGTDTPAGRGGAIIRVTNLNGDGPGSLRAAVSQSGPRTIIFDVGGVISITSDIDINQPYCTIAGETAPYPGITVYGAGIRVTTHDVLIKHIAARPGDRLPGPPGDDRHCFVFVNGAYNVVVDHCSGSWGVDENFGFTTGQNAHDVTVSYCIVSEALNNSIHPKGSHTRGFLVSSGSYNVSCIRNLFVHTGGRNPYYKSSTGEVINTYLYNPKGMGISVAQSGDGPAAVSIVGNVMKSGADTALTYDYVSLFVGSCNNKIYRSDNEKDGSTDCYYISGDMGCVEKATPQEVCWSGSSVLPRSEVRDELIANAGMRPADREDIDYRIIQDVINDTGRIIDSQNEVGGYPAYTQVNRVLTLPNNPNADDDGDGYTNLEEWLHLLAADLESGSRATKPNPYDGQAGVSLSANLTWVPGSIGPQDPCSHDLFFGTDFNEVLDATVTVPGPNITYVNVDVNIYDLPELEPLTSYYWRVDEVYGPNALKGEVWSFTTITAKAWNPTPQDKQNNIEVSAALSFNAGKLMDEDPCSHDIYIGTSYHAVNNATSSSHPGADYNNITETIYSPRDLWNMNSEYFWRVDEVYNTETVKGNIWRFEILDHISFEDFESYPNTDDLKMTWSDQSHPDNNSGSYISLHTASPQIMDNQSLLMYGFSNGSGYSETDRAIPPEYADFSPETGIGIKALYFWFYGLASNPTTDPLYVMLEDDVNSAMVYYPGSNDLKLEQWQLWRIDLSDFSGLNMSNITNITIGLGDRYSGSGGAAFVQIWLDDIDFYSSVCIPGLEPQGDLSGDCIVDFTDYSRLVKEWKNTTNLTADLFNDGIIDEKDLNVITTHWLANTRWP